MKPASAFTSRALAAALAGAAVFGASALSARGEPGPAGPVPHYDHIFVIVDENKNYDQIIDPAAAPNLAALARTYGSATRFYGEVHPSEANYVALVGGDTFGIHDDDAYDCKPGLAAPKCPGSAGAGYVDHSVEGESLADQIEAKGLTWKGYYGSLPEPGSLAVTASDPAFDNGTRKTALYASKHSGFMNFARVRADPKRAEHIVGLDQLDADIAADRLPAFALIVPNQCDDMHGLHGAGVPADCDGANLAALIRRGDAAAGAIVSKIQASAAWRGPGRTAIVITFDEGANRTREGCCGAGPDGPAGLGGGHIPTLVITNHGPRGVSDPTPYNHYSLLRTIEDALGLGGHLRHAADADAGVAPMSPLF